MNTRRLGCLETNTFQSIARESVLQMAMMGCDRPPSPDVTETATAPTSNLAASESAVTVPASVLAPTPTPTPVTTVGPYRTSLRATLLFCEAVSDAKQNHHINHPLEIDDLRQSSEAVAFNLNNADHKDVLLEFIRCRDAIPIGHRSKSRMRPSSQGQVLTAFEKRRLNYCSGFSGFSK